MSAPPWVVREVERVIGAGASAFGKAAASGTAIFSPLTPDQLAPGAPLTPAQLANLDRALTPDEQARVDAWQSGQSNAMQAAEESKPFINPLTGKKTVLRTEYTTEVSPWAFDWKMLIAPGVGGVLGALVGALVWKSHRVSGGFLGFGLGVTAGFAVEDVRSGKPPWRR